MADVVEGLVEESHVVLARDPARQRGLDDRDGQQAVAFARGLRDQLIMETQAATPEGDTFGGRR